MESVLSACTCIKNMHLHEDMYKLYSTSILGIATKFLKNQLTCLYDGYMIRPCYSLDLRC